MEREHEWNSSVNPDRQVQYKTIRCKIGGNGRYEEINLVENKQDSKLVKISSFEDQQTREIAINEFKNGTKRVLLCTNVCSRGLDLPNIDCVINYTLPEWHDGKAFQGLGSANNDFLYRLSS